MPHSWVEINLDSLAWNHRLVQEKIGPDAQCLAVVKANAYGHGMLEISTALYRLGVRWFGVASVYEGQILRKALPEAHILVLGYIHSDEIPCLLEENLVPTVSSILFAAELNARAERRRITRTLHVKIDTGMGRLGLPPAELDAFFKQIARMPHLVAEGILSHFSSADEEDLTHSQAQLKIFEEAVRKMKAVGLPVRWIYLANSNAVFRLQESHFNLVRCGLFLYGLYPSKDYPHNFGLKPVLEWKARAGLIKEFQPGQTVSYGRTHAVQQPTKIAIVPVGYADGYSRRLSNRGKVLIRGHFAPVVGRVTMDHIMVDVGHIPGIQEGDEVVLIGRQGKNQIRAEDIAAWLDTISYEVVCAIGHRVERKVIGSAISAVDTAQTIAQN